MGMAAIVVMRPGFPEQIFILPPHGSFTWNLDSIGPVISGKRCLKMLTDDWLMDGRTTDALLDYKLT